MSGGIPVKLLHEAEGHVVTCELKGGELSVSSPCLAHAPIAPSLLCVSGVTTCPSSGPERAHAGKCGVVDVVWWQAQMEVKDG